MVIADIIQHLETLAPPGLQESYDNAGLITGQPGWECTGILCSLDATEAIIEEAIANNCNLIVAHHPIVFGGLKKINGKNYVERTVIAAIKNDIAIYAIHTNLDNVIHGVNGKIAEILGLQKVQVLQPKQGQLQKLITFVPHQQAEQVRTAIFNAGGGHISNYTECSFNTEGTGTFKAGEGTNPYTGNIGEQHREPETRIEIIFPAWLQGAVIKAMQAAHPYEEVAYDIIPLLNQHHQTGAGLVGNLPQAMPETDFLQILKKLFQVPVIKHTALLQKNIQRVALCGGAGSFLINNALRSGADIFITGDMKYHEFFDADNRLIIADIGHYESEQFTINLLADGLAKKFTTFAVLKTKANTNPVKYFY
jgi:dinuclear metal center YbgI/SA1388 family protein